MVRTHPSLGTGLTVVLNVGGDRAILTRIGTIDALLADGHHRRRARRRTTRARRVASSCSRGCAGAAGRCSARAHERGATTSLDTNWDPSERVGRALRRAPAGRRAAGQCRRAAGAAPVAPGRSGRRSRRCGERRFVDAGTTVALKDGAAGGRVWTAGGHGHAPGLPVRLVDAVGAGDSFDAGFLAGRWPVSPPREALRWAVGCGSLSVRAAGGTAAQPDRAELLRALRLASVAWLAGRRRGAQAPYGVGDHRRPWPRGRVRGSGAGRPAPHPPRARARTAPVNATLSAVPMLTLTMPAATAAASSVAAAPRKNRAAPSGTGTASRSRAIRSRSRTAVRSVIACELPTATARASTPVASTNAAASSGSVRAPGLVGVERRLAVLAADLAELGLDPEPAPARPALTACAGHRDVVRVGRVLASTMTEPNDRASPGRAG